MMDTNLDGNSSATNLPAQRRGLAIPIRYAIPGLLAILIIVSVGLTGWLSFRSGTESVDVLATRLSEEVTVRIDEHIQSFVDVPNSVHFINDAAVDAGMLRLDDYEGARRYFWEQIDSPNAVPYLYYGAENGDFLGVDTNFGGEPVFKIRDSETAPFRVTYDLDENGNPGPEITRSEYDPRTRPWYTSAVEAGRFTWTPIYPSASAPFLVISAVSPIYDADNQLLGVLGIDLTLSEISDFLRQMEVSPNGEAFIIEQTGQLVAVSSEEQPFTTNDDGEQARLNAADSVTPLIQSTGQQIASLVDLTTITTTRELELNINGERTFVQVSPLSNDQGLNWLSVVVIPASDFLGPVYENLRNTVLIGVLVLVVATALGLGVSSWIIQPISRIIQAAKSIEAGNFDLAPIEGVMTRSDELGRLARVFSRMAREIHFREEKLKTEIVQLRIEIDEAKQETQVKEIVDSEFFKDLQEKAKLARGARGSRRRETTAEVAPESSPETPQDKPQDNPQP